MSEQAKISALIQTWMDYIRLSDLASAEVDAGSEEKTRIWDKGVSLVGDNLLLDAEVFQLLKQEFKDERQRNNNADDFQIAVAFPQIYLIKDGSRKFCPIFTIDISEIFQGNYRKSGWNLTKFKFQPVLPNLMNFYQLDEEGTESLVIREGLKVFLEDTFSHSFSTLQNFLDLIELPPHPVRSKPLPYLLRFNYVPFSYNLKKDFQKILAQRNWNWATPGHPAWEYLFGQPTPPNHQQLFLGAFSIAPPNEFQAAALKHATTNPITTVIGPPGSGKTDLLLHAIAQQVAKRAVHLAQTNSDISNLTLVTSTNNRAISNVEGRLASCLPTERFYLSGGAREAIAQAVSPKLQLAIDWLRSAEFDEVERSQTKSRLLSAVDEFQQHQQQDRNHSAHQSTDERLLHGILGDIQILSSRIEENQGFESNLQERLNDFSDYSQFPHAEYERIGLQLESAWLKLAKQEPKRTERTGGWKRQLENLLQKVWRILTFSSDGWIVRRLKQKIEAAVLATKDTPFPVEFPLNRRRLEVVRKNVASQSKAASQWRQLQQQLAQTQNQLSTDRQRLNALVAQRQQVQSRLASCPTADFYTRFYTQFHDLQQHLFELSWSFLQQEALRRKQEIISSLSIYRDVLNRDSNAFSQLARDWQNIYRDISLLFPVFISTLHSLRNLLPHPDSGSIDRLIVDEAGMILQHHLFPALVRSKQALIVGDPWQLEPVINFHADSLKEYCTQAFLTRGLTDEDYDRYSPAAGCTAYHRAAGASGRVGDLGVGIILKEHYRCAPPIIQFCDRLCNYGLIVKTPPRESAFGPNLIAYHVEGNYQNYTNPEEIEAVEAIIDRLLSYGYCIDSPNNEKTIGVISPYRRQAHALQYKLQSRWKNFPNDSIGTVHTFQGGEKSAIVFSTRQHRTEDSLWFINRRLNLLNVAVSRAKESFILVGNLDLLQKEGYTRQLVEYIQGCGEIRSLLR
ncbi:MAG: ATP-dependent RecD-like DNA helicase [Chroococcidiopsis sp. SAG 2025]|uniref:DEAD/DEAH box helicase n=1 Tax=Chroococcidiopsis sp. SAG 2025 TaxID=171389 RepID=UPI0029373F51|nr:AAA domain-containing protein [Chroococcidiopsis sp. SAG 2025]MDV2998242.1 ATP-dependent RecD-like DNA helicase [Chroococcidiopsis sp. SAG 2025]